MAKHTLAPGVELISALLDLGKTLEYFTKDEFPTEQPAEGGPAVDVAWLADERQRFPIMIFEVESAVTNSAANNPVKVFGPPNEQFEKPLFFFHIFITGGPNTSRLDNLRHFLGTHNYRTYELDGGEISVLLKDILSQHRRLAISLNIVALVQFLERIPRFRPHIDEVLMHVESLKFDLNYISTYAVLTKGNVRYLDHFIRHLHNYHSTPNIKREDSAYSTFIASVYGDAIQLGILHSWSPYDKKDLFTKLKEWQEHSLERLQIGPYFGLSYDYDQFIIGLAPPFWALIASLMRADQDAVRYILKQCWLIFDDHEPSEYSAFWALWILHIAASIKAGEDFERARIHINDLGGLNPSYLYAPPSVLNPEEDDEWFEDSQLKAEPIPDLRTFIDHHPMRWISGSSPQRLLDLVLSILVDEAAFYEWARPLVSALAPMDNTLTSN